MTKINNTLSRNQKEVLDRKTGAMKSTTRDTCFLIALLPFVSFVPFQSISHLHELVD